MSSRAENACPARTGCNVTLLAAENSRHYNILMSKSIAIIGAGVSGLTCAVLFAERGYRTAIFAEEIGQRTTSGAAGALWFPYDAEPADKVIPWALETYKVLVDLSRDPRSGVSMIQLRQKLCVDQLLRQRSPCDSRVQQKQSRRSIPTRLRQ